MDGVVVTLMAALASLAGSEWGPITEAKPERFVQFRESDVSGHSGCNRFFGRYTLKGPSIRIGPLAGTRMACAPDVMKAEREWLTMLERTRMIEATPLRLTLRDARGAHLATLRRRDVD